MTLVNTQINHANYVIDGDFVSERDGPGLRGREFYIYKTRDGTEWVRLANFQKSKERFCGFLYLQNAKLNNVVPSENKMAKYRGGIIYLSKYCGENRPNAFQACEAIAELIKVGYKDLSMCANMRVVDHKIHLFDTEKSSFDSNVHEKIDAFANLHDAIRAYIESTSKS